MMFDDTGDEPLDPTLLEAARNYNAPPTVPREAMWSAIQTSRRKPVAESQVRSIQSATPIASRRKWRPAWPIATAAGLVLATGIAIGRWTGTPPAQTVAAAPRHPARRAPAIARGDRAAYQVTVAQNLTQAEALLTAYSTGSQSPAGQSGSVGVASWARDVLSNTRLLLDSPAAADPKQRRLLEDLELVLVQLVEVSPDSSGAERQMIDSTLEHDHVLSRIRYAVPTGATGI
jgi:hypothetical protein